MKKLNAIFFLLFTCVFAYSQNIIISSFPGHANQQIKLLGFKGFDTYPIDSIQANSKGEFNLKFSKNDDGMAYLIAEDGKSFMIILAENENLQLRGETLALPAKIEIVEGNQNQLFDQYATEHPRRNQTLSAWDYLEKIYKNDSLFRIHEIPQKAIEKEKQRINAEDSLFLAGMPHSTYVSWYLPVRKLVSSVSAIAQYRAKEAPAAIIAFRALDYTDARIYRNGLLKESLEAHFWLIENSSPSLDSAYLEMNKSIDVLIENLLADEQKLNEISEYLFKLLEKRSLLRASEYLALKLLNETSCTINNDFSAQLESYRVMKIGNTATDFAFGKDFLAPAYEPSQLPQKLSDLNSEYTLVVFGASWCPQCPLELSKIARLYEKWKNYNLEVIFVSLDEENDVFNSFAGVFPFISICDFQKWESPIVKDYHVFATPSIYLLDNNRTILLRPNSVDQLDSWVDWYLIQGKK